MQSTKLSTVATRSFERRWDMADEVFRLFDEYAARFARGERPDAREYLARAGEGADELAALIDRFLEGAPAPPADAEARALAQAWLEGEPPLLALRTQRGLRREAVVEALVGRLALDPGKRKKVERYYHRLETGLLDPARVSSRVFDVLAETLRTSLADVRGWRPRPATAEGVYLRAAEPEMAAPPTAAAEPGERDEIDALFLDGGDAT
jgi:hypothetical protein